jgi:predicted XRE-type DNA-binding protein
MAAERERLDRIAEDDADTKSLELQSEIMLKVSQVIKETAEKQKATRLAITQANVTASEHQKTSNNDKLFD